VSQPSLNEQPALAEPKQRYRKPRVDLYTVMLVIALVALIVGTILLYAQQGTWDYEIKGGPTPMVRAWFDAARSYVGLC
jgi:hypothetical protein